MSAADPHPVVLIPGDGIGPEISEAAVAALAAAGAPIAWRDHRAGDAARARGGDVTRAITDALAGA